MLLYLAESAHLVYLYCTSVINILHFPESFFNEQQRACRATYSQNATSLTATVHSALLTRRAVEKVAP